MQLQKGVEIGFEGKKYITKPSRVFSVSKIPTFPTRQKKIRDARHGPSTWIRVIITEGKFRQIRKMTAAVGYPTLRLLRVRVGNITLGRLNPGEVQALEILL